MPMPSPLKIIRTPAGAVVQDRTASYLLPGFAWDSLFHDDNPLALVTRMIAGAARQQGAPEALAPSLHQEVWAAGVTYYRSRDARIEESKGAGGGDFYARVYDAPRPELFYKSSPHRIAGPGSKVRIRKDSRWNVPEPELTLAFNRQRRIFGYTIGNDMSSRDIEGENPLYLPQAKSYDQAAGLGPCILLSDEMLPPTTEIRLVISRGASEMFTGATTLAQLKRKPEELVEFLTREMGFPDGGFLMTGTGIVPPNEFTLLAGDRIAITIAPIGTLENVVG
jgi:2-dehydro-3-deoxy-D-arabinonate dehydratase